MTGLSVRTYTDSHEVFFKPAVHPGQVIGDQFVDQLRNSLPRFARCRKRGELANGRHGIGHCYRAFAAFEEGVIVLGIADADRFVRR